MPERSFITYHRERLAMSKPNLPDSVFQRRLTALKELMRHESLDAIVLPPGGELGWLIGYDNEPIDQNAALVVTADDSPPTLVISVLEYQADLMRPDVCRAASYAASVRFVPSILEALAMENGVIGVGDRLWAKTLRPLQDARPGCAWPLASTVIDRLRRTKDEAEIDALAAVAAAVDRTVVELQTGVIRLRGRTETAVAQDIRASMLRHGHETIDFILVAAGPNAAVGHHTPDETVIGDGPVLFDIGGKLNGYSSDTTRCVCLGQPSERLQRAYDALREAQLLAQAAARPGITGTDLDAVARDFLVAAGYPPYPHCLSHGIGRDCHEAPKAGPACPDPIQVGDAISIEPGIYVAGEYGLRLENIVIITDGECRVLNRTDDRLVVVPE